MFDIGNRIIFLRNLHDISANKLAKELKVDPSTINKIEKGTAKPSIDLLFNICSYFDITLAEFFDTNSSRTDLPTDLLQLLETAKKLSPEQRSKLNDFIQSMLSTFPMISATSLKGELRNAVNQINKKNLFNNKLKG